MSRHATGEKATDTKAGRRHSKFVAEMIRKHGNAAYDDNATSMTPAQIAKWDSTWRHMAKAHSRYSRKQGWS